MVNKMSTVNLKFLIFFSNVLFISCSTIKSWPNFKNLDVYNSEEISKLNFEEFSSFDSETLCRIVTSEIVGPATIVRIINNSVGKYWLEPDFLQCLKENVKDRSKIPTNLRIAAPDILSLIPSHYFYDYIFFHTFSGLLTEGLTGNFAEENDWEEKRILLSLYLDLIDYSNLIQDHILCRLIAENIANDISASFWRYNNEKSIWKTFPCASGKIIDSKYFKWLPVLDHKNVQSNTLSKFELSSRIFSDKRLVKELDFFKNYSYILNNAWSSDFLLNVFSAKTDIATVQHISSQTSNFIILQNIESALVSYTRKQNLFLANPNFSLNSEINYSFRHLQTKPDDFGALLAQLNQVKLIEQKQILISDLIYRKVQFDTTNSDLTQYFDFLGKNVKGIKFEDIATLNTQDQKVISFFITQAENLNSVQKFIHAQKTQKLIGNANLLKNLFNFGFEYVQEFGIFNFRVRDLLNVLGQNYSPEKGFQKIDFFSKTLSDMKLNLVTKRFLLDTTKDFTLNTNTSKTITGFEQILTVSDVQNTNQFEILDVLSVLDKSKLSLKVVQTFAEIAENLQRRKFKLATNEGTLNTFSKSELRLIGGEILSQFDIESWKNLNNSKCLYIVELIGQTNTCKYTSNEKRKQIIDNLLTKCNISEYKNNNREKALTMVGNLAANFIERNVSVDLDIILRNVQFLENSCWDDSTGQSLRNLLLASSDRDKIQWYPIILSLKTKFYNLLERKSELSYLIEKSVTNAKLRESLLFLSRQKASMTKEIDFHKFLVDQIVEKIFPLYESSSTCWRNEQLSILTCHKLRSLGPSLRYVNSSVLEKMDICELRKCFDYISNHEEATISHLNMMLQKLRSNPEVNEDFSSDRQKISALGKILPMMEDFEISELNLDYSDRNVLYQLGKITTWEPIQLQSIMSRVQMQTGIEIEQLEAVDVKVLGNLICGFPSDELLGFPLKIMEQAIQDLGKRIDYILMGNILKKLTIDKNEIINFLTSFIVV